ncbi:MAG: PepSY domain-containing protein [Alicyclobacillus herbarius]|uniref:PepSY domain-containing protein n=1 Tax=Alicyclobacillus herbarius TaxID=122960 RepID=UPI001B7FB8F7|nr:PepSY domain-containing protein [Alicyclobacillus herbarius]MCL6632662.1 PepSY domain-containing protein [Alicyclobacillus herbarius]
MRKWLLATSVCLMMGSVIPVAWAGDGLWRHVPSTHYHGTVRAVTGHPFVEPTDGTHAWQLRSSVRVSRQVLREAYMASRNAYTQKLQKYAKVTAAQAEKAISQAHPGMKVEDVQLRNIRTDLVYTGIAQDDEERYLVIVDAGNGKLLLDKPLPTHHQRVFSGD